MFKVKSASKFTLLEKRWAASCGYYMLLGRFGTNSIRNFGTWLISLSLSLRAKASVNRIDDDYTNMWSPLYHWNSLNLITYNQREHAYIILLPNYPSRLRRSTWRRWSNFHVSNIQNDREPGLISNRSHHSKVFFWFTLPLFLHVLWMWPWNHQRFQEPAQHYFLKISRWIIQEQVSICVFPCTIQPSPCQGDPLIGVSKHCLCQHKWDGPAPSINVSWIHSDTQKRDEKDGENGQRSEIGWTCFGTDGNPSWVESDLRI